MLARRWRPSEHRRFLALIPRGDPHVALGLATRRRSDRRSAATDRDAIPGEVSSDFGHRAANAVRDDDGSRAT